MEPATTRRRFVLAGTLVSVPPVLAPSFSASRAAAQTLARPGWAGSGLNGEPWWRSAVFYRVDPQTFQDSDGDGIGDIPGLTSRLDYLQSLGVDGLILDSRPRAATSRPASARPAAAAPSLPFPVIDDPGFDELVSEASRRHLRLVIAQPSSADAVNLLARARSALTRGVAGIEFSTGPAAPTAAAANAPYLLSELRTLAASFPGERIILSNGDASQAGSLSLHPPRRAGSLHLRGSEAPEITVLPLPTRPGSAAEAANSLRSLVSTAEALPTGAAPLFRAETPAAISTETLSAPLAAFLALRLLTLHGAFTIDAGQELGYLPSATLAGDASVPGASSPGTTRLLMPWTPRNITPPTVKIEPNPDPPPARSDVYGAYRPYVPVKPKPVVLPGAAPPPPEPDSLPGFTSASLPYPAPAAFDTAHRNVAVEDLDPHSVLNLYRRLIALHHGHATLRTGSSSVLDLPGTSAAVWIRRAPAGARTVASVIAACNLSDTPVTLSLDAELTRDHIRPGLLRPLLGTATLPNGPQSTSHLTLAPHSLYIGEIYHH